ncbi:hypothetical protein CPC08DRAFT_196203 [Agrocybe pediades]|nr:hypothetical protein CPC08DRAFT_196203 [Agrocybe pediades]
MPDKFKLGDGNLTFTPGVILLFAVSTKSHIQELYRGLLGHATTSEHMAPSSSQLQGAVFPKLSSSLQTILDSLPIQGRRHSRNTTAPIRPGSTYILRHTR